MLAKISLTIGLLALLFAGFLRGAPYVPTHRRQVEAALDLLDLKPGSLVVDLGSGDGVFLQAAAQRGLRAIGYEINPLLCLWSRWRLRRHSNDVRVYWRDFWHVRPPADTDAIFIFLGGIFMKRFGTWLTTVQATRQRPLSVVSYGFELPGQQADASKEGMKVYHLSPSAPSVDNS